MTSATINGVAVCRYSAIGIETHAGAARRFDCVAGYDEVKAVGGIDSVAGDIPDRIVINRAADGADQSNARSCRGVDAVAPKMADGPGQHTQTCRGQRVILDFPNRIGGDRDAVRDAIGYRVAVRAAAGVDTDHNAPSARRVNIRNGVVRDVDGHTGGGLDACGRAT